LNAEGIKHWIYTFMVEPIDWKEITYCLLFPSYIMSEVSEAIPTKFLAIDDRIIKLNDYLLIQAVNIKNWW
jgi:hypothetical protein